MNFTEHLARAAPRNRPVAGAKPKGEPTMLPDGYKQALQALKDQAAAATMQLENRSAGKSELADAQRRMAQHSAEVNSIVRVVLRAKGPSIPDLTEARLAELLGLAA